LWEIPGGALRLEPGARCALFEGSNLSSKVRALALVPRSPSTPKPRCADGSRIGGPEAVGAFSGRWHRRQTTWKTSRYPSWGPQA
jgi:hypothetical protein